MAKRKSLPQEAERKAEESAIDERHRALFDMFHEILAGSEDVNVRIRVGDMVMRRSPGGGLHITEAETEETAVLEWERDVPTGYVSPNLDPMRNVYTQSYFFERLDRQQQKGEGSLAEMIGQALLGEDWRMPNVSISMNNRGPYLEIDVRPLASKPPIGCVIVPDEIGLTAEPDMKNFIDRIQNDRLNQSEQGSTEGAERKAEMADRAQDAFHGASAEKIIGSKLRAAREDAGMTQVEVAKAMGTDHRAVRRIEQGETNARVETIYRFANVVGLDIFN